MSAARARGPGTKLAASTTGGAVTETIVQPVRSGLMAARAFTEVRFGGSGGQGVILMGVILAMAATRDHRFVVQTQSYGPEARGGYSRSDVIVSDSPIDYPELLGLDLLVALSQQSATGYMRLLRPDGVLVYDSENVTQLPAFSGVRFGIPFTRLAVEETGRRQTTNILTLGAVIGITGVVSVESLKKAVKGMVPSGTEEVNAKALARGLSLDPEEYRQKEAVGVDPTMEDPRDLGGRE
jgi:2-oxoglutarate ferredoxin oxidoreductase subunit gamma